MKRIAIFLVVLFLMLANQADAHRYRGGVSFNYFYSSLTPYGEWIEIDYDVYVWKPFNMHVEWQPYADGRWSWTSSGWYWESYEPFGWATYHYGRWYFDDNYGWVWFPGYQWAPAWVEWRYSPDYIGWAPLSPYASFSFGFGVRFSMNYRTIYRNWHFVKYDHFCTPRVNRYFVKYRDRNYIYNHTKYRTNYYGRNGRIVNGGVDRTYVEHRSGRKIKQREISVVSDINTYSKYRSPNSNRIVSYMPSDNEVRRYDNISRTKVRKDFGRTSMNTDKIYRSERSRNETVKKSVLYGGEDSYEHSNRTVRNRDDVRERSNRNNNGYKEYKERNRKVIEDHSKREKRRSDEKFNSSEKSKSYKVSNNSNKKSHRVKRNSSDVNNHSKKGKKQRSKSRS